jgi:hypothetical protein
MHGRKDPTPEVVNRTQSSRNGMVAQHPTSFTDTYSRDFSLRLFDGQMSCLRKQGLQLVKLSASVVTARGRKVMYCQGIDDSKTKVVIGYHPGPPELDPPCHAEILG